MKKTPFLIAALMLFCGLCYAQQGGVIDRTLQAAIENGTNEMVSINIVLKSQAEPARIKALAARSRDNRAARGLMVSGLKEHSKKNQAAVLDFLQKAMNNGGVANIVTHWIANAISCDATKEVVEALAAHPDVLMVALNKEVCVVESCEPVGEAELPAVAASHSATPHILQVNADDVWVQGYTGKNVVVAVLDSGTNPDHYDLKDHLWQGYADTDCDGEKDDPINGWNFVDNSSNIADDFGHGTHCAGIVCGDGTVGNVTGVAPDATLMTVKVVNRSGGGTPEQMIAGVEFAIENGANVLSLSLGFKSSQISEGQIALLRQTFENTLLLGVPVCAAVGNDGNSYGAPNNVDIPAACPPPYLHPNQQVNQGGLTSIISVGSVNEYDEYVTSSSQGPVTWQETSFADYLYDSEHIGLIRPDISAPGNLVYSLKHDENDKYKYMSGTSQATPCVAGVIALMLEKNPTLTPAQICEIIETTAKKLTASKSNRTGSGRIDALAAIGAVVAKNERPFIRVDNYSPKSMSAGAGKEISFVVSNSGKGASSGNVRSELSTNDPYISFVNSVVNHGEMSSGATADGAFVINVSDDVPNGHIAYMKVTTTDGVSEWVDDIAIKLDNYAKIVYQSSPLGMVKPGKNIVVNIDVVNKGTVATVSETMVAIKTSSPYVAIVSGEAVLEPMAVGEVRTVSFIVDIDEAIPDNNSISFDLYAVPNNYTAIESFVYEFEPGLDADGYVTDGFLSWTTFDANNDGRNHPWWHSSMAGTHKVGDVGAAHSGEGQMMSEAYCQASMMEYTVPIDNYLVSPKVKVASGGRVSFWARIHSKPSKEWFGEHFGVAVSESGNSSAADFTTIEEWAITREDGNGWIEYTADLSAYEGKEIYVAIRHFFTAEQWEALDNGWDVYILHVDDVSFHNVIDVSTEFVYDNYSYFSLLVEGNPLPAPSGVAAKAVDTRSIKITWNAVKYAQRYNIYRDGVYMATTQELEFLDSDLYSDTEYSYCVAAVYNNKEYEWSAAATAITAKADYSVKIKSVNAKVLQVGKNTFQITMVNNGRYEQKSRSTLTLSTDNPCVRVVTGSVGMSYLRAGEESTKNFTVEIDKLTPDGHKIYFNINVTELFEDKNSWDCPFALTVENDGREALVAEAMALVDGWGVGYPDDDAKQAYCEAVDAAIVYSDIVAAQKALRAADVKMPADGQAYYIKAKFSDGSFRYLHDNGSGLGVVADANVKPTGYSGTFVFRKVDSGVYALVSNVGGYMVYCADGKKGAGGVANGFATDYELGENDAEVIFVPGKELVPTNPVTVDAATEFFGGFAMQAYNESDKEMYYMTAGVAGFHSLNSNSVFYKDDYSSLFYLEEAQYPNTPKLNDISNSTLIVGIEERGLATFSAPFPVLIPDDVVVYYAQKLTGGFITLIAYDGDVLPANEGVLIAGDVGVVTMAPALGTSVDGIEDNIFSHSAGKAVELQHGGAYLLAGGADGPGFYLCSAGVLAMNKAYLPSVGNQSAYNVSLRYQATTEVVEIECEERLDDVIYDLCGRRVINPTSGVYIVGGKKVFIK